MCEWQECKLGDVVLIDTGFAFKSKYYSEEGNLRVVRGKNVTVGATRWGSNSQFWNHSTIGLEKYFLKEFDIVIGMDGSKIGENRSQIKKSNLPAILAQRVARLRAKENADQIFIWHLIFSDNFENYIKSIYTGTSIPHISQSQIADFEMSLPPLPEQRAIASVLSSLDDKIDLLHHQNKTLEAMAETLFRQWFVEEADEGWETARVGDFVRTNVASINKDNALKTIRYLDTGSLTEGKIDGYQTFDIGDAPSRARRIVKTNDVLISTVRPNQKHYGILKNPAEDVIVSTGFCVITCDKINPHFIYILLTTDEMTEYLHSIAEGSTSTYPSLKPSDIEGLEFQLPPQEKLDAFSEYADNAWSKIEYNHTHIITLEKLRDTLLPKLMSGEVRIQFGQEATV